MTRTEKAALDRKLAFWSATNEQHQIDKHNAAMVAELLAALENLLRWQDSGNNPPTASDWSKARAVIAKARS